MEVNQDLTKMLLEAAEQIHARTFRNIITQLVETLNQEEL